MRSNSYDEVGIHNSTERYIWATYHIIVLLSSLLGDSLILYASFHKDAFKINKFILTVIQHIAATDLAYSIFSILPRTISLLTNSWVLGDAACHARVYSGYFLYGVGLYVRTDRIDFFVAGPDRTGLKNSDPAAGQNHNGPDYRLKH